MVNRMKLVSVIGLVIVMSGCATIHHTDSTKLETISVSDIESDPQKYQEIIGRSINDGRELVIFIKAGQSVPLRINILLPMARFMGKQSHLAFTQDTYLLISHSKFRISPDGQRWSDVSDLESDKKLFGFNKGEVSAGFQVTREDGPVISLDLLTE